MLAIQMRSAEHALQHAGRLPMLKRWPLQGDAELNRGTLDVRVSRKLDHFSRCRISPITLNRACSENLEFCT